MSEPTLERRCNSASQALNALKNLRFQFTTALTLGKPVGSKIKLTKNWDSLEIIVPPVGFKPSTIYAGFVCNRLEFTLPYLGQLSVLIDSFILATFLLFICVLTSIFGFWLVYDMYYFLVFVWIHPLTPESGANCFNSRVTGIGNFITPVHHQEKVSPS